MCLLENMWLHNLAGLPIISSSTEVDYPMNYEILSLNYITVIFIKEGFTFTNEQASDVISIQVIHSGL